MAVLHSILHGVQHSILHGVQHRGARLFSSLSRSFTESGACIIGVTSLVRVRVIERVRIRVRISVTISVRIRVIERVRIRVRHRGSP